MSGSVETDRRLFLDRVWTWLGWLAGGVLLYPVFRFLDYRVPRQPRRVTVHKPVPVAGFLVEHDFILFADSAGTWAVSRKCTHLGCRLNYQEKEGLLLCPCHQSRFSKKGLRLAGPARRNLPLFPVDLIKEGTELRGYRVSL